MGATDLELVERFTRGADEAAFAELYRRHVDRVHRVAARILGPAGDLDDAVQEVFVQLHRSLERFRGDSQLTTWLHRLTVNVTTSALRRRVRGPVLVDPREPGPDPGERLEAREEVHALYRALDRLPEHNRVAFVLYELEGLRLEELAEATGVPLQAAAARLRRARVALARELGREPAAEVRPAREEEP